MPHSAAHRPPRPSTGGRGTNAALFALLGAAWSAQAQTLPPPAERGNLPRAGALAADLLPGR
ncbi:hypothetical protein, partial [Ideonella livida]